MKKVFLFIAACLCIAVVSCTKEKEEKTPSITRIVDVLGTDISRATLGSTITVVGNNLTGIISVNADGIDVTESAVVSKNSVNVTLPAILPETPTGKLVITTKGGSADAPFSIYAMIELYGMKCEYVLPGSDLKIKGRYFAANGFSPTSGKCTIGGKEAVIKSVTAEEMTVVVPSDASDNSEVLLFGPTVSDKGIKVPGTYRDTECMINDLELGKGAGYYLVDKAEYPGDPAVASDITPIQGNAYIHYHHWTGPKYGERKAEYYGDYNWDKLTTNSWQNTKIIPTDALTNPQNYAFKFEVKTNVPNKLRFYLYWKDATAGSFGVYWPDYDIPADSRRDYKAEGLSDEQKKEIIMADYAATFDTKGEWVTVSIPFTLFMKHKDAEGKEIAGFSTEDIGKEVLHEMPVHTEYIQLVNDIYFDCFRISRIN